MTSLLRHPVRIVALVALVAVAVGGFVLWHRVGSSTPADTGGAVAAFRQQHIPAGARPDGVPAYGVYRFAVTGHESAGNGMLTASRPLPREAVYVIDPLAGGYHENLELSAEHIEEARYAVGSEGAKATWRRTKITFLGVGADDRDAVTPAALDHPATFAVGRSWGGRYHLGKLGVSYRSRVTGTDTAMLDGKRIPVFVFRTQATFTGPTPGSRTDVVKWSPELNMPVAWHITQKTGGSADYAIDADMTLVSGTPLT
jgi:hypothetical protein